MATTADYLTQLQADKQTLVDNLVAKGVEASNDETFTSLVPKVADIQSGGGSTENFEITNPSYLFYNGARVDIMELLCSKIASTCTDFKYTFAYCRNLTEIPQLDTSNATTMEFMFTSCSKLTEIPQLDTSNVTTMVYTFNGCSNLTTIPEMNTSKVTTFQDTFHSCSKLTTIPQLDTSSCTNFDSMINQCSLLTAIPQLDTSKGTTFNMFAYNCTNLTTIPQLDFSKAINLNAAFNCKNLTTLGGFVNLGKAYTQKTANYSSYTLTLSQSTNLTHDSLMNVINNLYDLNLTYDVANGGTLYTQKLVLGATNLAKLTEEEIAIATAKGWSVS